MVLFSFVSHFALSRNDHGSINKKGKPLSSRSVVNKPTYPQRCNFLSDKKCVVNKPQTQHG